MEVMTFVVPCLFGLEGLAAEELRQKLQNDGVHYYHEAG